MCWLAVILIGMLWFPSSLYAWEALQEPGYAQSFADIHFADEQRGWAIAYRGRILHTEDGGETWSPQKVEMPYHTEIYSICFADDLHGWVSGYYLDDSTDRIAHTDDGGVTWQALKFEHGIAPYDIFFVDATEGWICGRAIRHTEDAGDTWDTQYAGEGYVLLLFRDVFFIDRHRGWCIGFGGRTQGEGVDIIVGTTDGGQTWEEQYHQRADVGNEGRWDSSLWFVDENEGWAAIGAPTPILLHTVDGGTHWQQHDFSGGAWWNDIQFVNPQEGWIAGAENTPESTPLSGRGVLFHTQDGGESWQMQAEQESTFRAVHFVDSQIGWATGRTGSILHTSDGGTEWTAQVERKPYYHDLSFIDSQRGWMLAWMVQETQEPSLTSVILHTEDGGRRWQEQPCKLPEGDQQRLQTIHFIDSQHGWAGGYILGDPTTRVLLRTSDGGKHWSVDEVECTPRSLHFLNERDGWMVATAGDGTVELLFTQDGGQRWELQKRASSPSGAVQVLDSRRVWMNAQRQLHYTSDGGRTWESPKTPEVYQFYFVDEQVGWFGLGEDLYRTDDGCRNYQRQELPVPVTGIQGIYFRNALEGWCLSFYNFGNSLERGFIFHTTDGGETWEVALKSHQRLFSFGYTEDRIWAIGLNGTIYSMALQPTGMATTWGQVKTMLLPNYPNPFNPETWIPYQLGSSAEVTITIHSLLGHTVRTLRPGFQPAGSYTSQERAAYWDGRNDTGSLVASGLYFCTLQAGDSANSRRMTVVR